MKTPILSVKDLTIRFGGLTAVQDVSVDVQEGEIFSIIGPNGAGKTTVFNAITGIYEPTEGSVSVDGVELVSPLTRGHIARFCLVGLSVGILVLLFVANVDLLWSATVKQNFHGREKGFDIAGAVQASVDHLMAEPRVEAALGGFRVVSFDGKKSFGRAKTKELAADNLAAVQRLMGMGVSAPIRARQPGFGMVDEAGVVLVSGPTEAAVAAQAAAILESATDAGKARRTRLLSFLFAAVLGGLGAFAIFRQTRRTPSYIATRGIARTFQNIRLFQSMSVRENVLAGMDRRLRATSAGKSLLDDLLVPAVIAVLLVGIAVSMRLGWLNAPVGTALLSLPLLLLIGYVVHLVRLGALSRAELTLEHTAAKDADELLQFVGLLPVADDQARNLSYGNQRRLEIARALATGPRLLLLDEPAAGMNPNETVSLMKLIQDIRTRGTTVVLIEHHMRVVMGISDRIAVLEYGRKIAEGTPDAIRSDPRVIEAYLGKEELG